MAQSRARSAAAVCCLLPAGAAAHINTQLLQAASVPMMPVTAMMAAHSSSPRRPRPVGDVMNGMEGVGMHALVKVGALVQSPTPSLPALQQVGLVAFGPPGYGQVAHIRAYVRVSAVMPWITRTVARIS